MVIFALLTMGAVLVAVATGLHILKKEYLPLLRELFPRQMLQHRWHQGTDGEEEVP